MVALVVPNFVVVVIVGVVLMFIVMCLLAVAAR